MSGLRNSVANQYIDNISNFVEQMRLHQEFQDHHQQEGAVVVNQVGIREQPLQPEYLEEEGEKRDERRSEARTSAERIIREAELFRANIEHPKGYVKNNLDFRQWMMKFFTSLVTLTAL